MSAIDVLRRARAQIAAGGRDVFAALYIGNGTSAEADEAFELLELVATPAWVAMEVAVAKWATTQKDADGIAAVRATKRPGATVNLEAWLKGGRRVGEVLEVFDKAIKKGATR